MKVLMLGWEFPPVFTGGLGIATLGIVKALRNHADIRLIVPSAQGASGLSNVNIIGLNAFALDDAQLEQVRTDYAAIGVEMHTLDMRVSPYQFMNEKLAHHESLDLDTGSTDQLKGAIQSLFTTQDAYGGTIWKKVLLFSLLAEQIASKGDFDIIHAHDWITFHAALRIKERFKRPLVLHIHSLETDRAGAHVRNEIYQLERHAMDHADCIISVSQYTKEQIIMHYGIPAEKINVVHNGIEASEKKRKAHRLRDKLVVFLGRLTYQKGPEFLLETAEKVTRVFPRVKFVVAGTGDEFAHLLETSAYKKMGNKFLFTGFLSKDNVDELLSVADVYFMPSVSEPFGLTALEAVQHRVPSVLSSQSGAAEVIHASLQADFWDTDKYANYIYALLKYNTLSLALSETAIRGLETLTWDTTAEKINNIYKHLCDLDRPE